MTDIEGWQSRANRNIIRSLKKKEQTKRQEKYFKIKLKEIFLA